MASSFEPIGPSNFYADKLCDMNTFTPFLPGLGGSRRCCTGKHKDPTGDWYGYIRCGTRVPPATLSFCDHCAKNAFSQEEVFKITHSEYPGLVPMLVCDTYQNDVLKNFGLLNRRKMQYMGFEIGVNAVDPRDDDSFVPLVTLPEKREVMSGGTGIFLCPSKMYWEFTVNPNKMFWSKNNHFKVSARFGDGRVVEILSKSGSSNFVSPCHGGLINVNAYKPGKGHRFFFDVPSDAEREAGLAASHDKQSNKLYITVEVFEDVTPPAPVYRDGATYRGGATRGGATRGGGDDATYRGGATRGGAQGGTNYAAAGHSEGFSTTKRNWKLVPVKKIEVRIQLVNTESQEELEYMSGLVQTSIETKRQEEIERKRAELKLLEEQRRVPTAHAKALGMTKVGSSADFI